MLAQSRAQRRNAVCRWPGQLEVLLLPRSQICNLHLTRDTTCLRRDATSPKLTTTTKNIEGEPSLWLLPARTTNTHLYEIYSETFFVNSMSSFILVLIAAYSLVLLSLSAHSFSVAPSRAAFQYHLATTTHLCSSTEDNNDSMDFSNFNPFQYQARSTDVLGMSGTQISLRKTGMQQLVGELLSVYGNDDEMQATIDKYKEFLLEPLEDLEAVLDPESIYINIHTRQERYGAYRTSMEERIATAKDTKAKNVLMAMMKYVLQYE